MQVVLVMFRGEGEGERRSFSIVRDVTVIGRREDCDFRIPLGEISRKHCRLIKEGDTLRAEDLGSSNGTYVNGTRVQEAPLSPGDTLKVGSVVFVVQIDGVPGDADLKPATAGSASAADTASEDDELLEPQTTMPADDAEDLSMMAGDDPSVGPADDLSALPGDEPTVDDQPDESIGHNFPAAGESGDEAGDQYDPMSVLASDADASSIGSMLDGDRIADDLMSELESNERAKPKS